MEAYPPIRFAARQRAFSLVELSIVLVILGLLVGGILSGQALIRAAELRKLSASIPKYQAAAFTFRDKYFAIPGDMRNASSFWPTAVNGLGTNYLLWSLQGVNFWNHLQQAGLVEGTIAPVSAPLTQLTIDTHVPRCPLGNCGYSMVYFSVWTIQPHLVGRNIMVVGTEATNNYTAGNVAGLRSEDIWNIDTKIDDGKPDLGTILARPTCSDGNYPDRTYALTNTGTPCVLHIDFFK